MSFLLTSLLGFLSFFFYSPSFFHIDYLNDYSGNRAATSIQHTGGQPAVTSTLAPLADAYTNNGTYATTNYGTVTTLLVKTTNTASVARATYLKFGLGTVNGTVRSAVLRLYGHATLAGSTTAMNAYGITNDAWTETGITWNTAPVAGASLSSVNITDQVQYWELDVSAFVQAQVAGDKTASFLIKNPTNIDRYFSFNSKENSKFQPQLVITTIANQPPVLGTIDDKTVVAGQLLSFTATATDPDAGQTKAYSLIGAPAGAAINASTGVFTWTPTTTGSYNFTVRVTDNGSPVLFDDKSVTVTVSDPPNQQPSLTISDKTVVINQLLTFTATATDPDASQSITYSLTGSIPTDAAINPASGEFTWTPTATGSFTFGIRAMDNGSPALYDEKQLTVTVTDPPPNQMPTLAAIGNKLITLGQTVNFTASGTDPDAGQRLSYSLTGMPPSDAAINATSGVFSWTPAATGSYTFGVRATDNGSPALYSEEQITVTVAENQAPVLDSIHNRMLTLGQTLTFTATATDPDPGQAKIFYLIDAPDDASINENTGAFTWTPATAGAFTFIIHASDDGIPALTDEEQITVTVNTPNQSPVLASIGDKTINTGTTLGFTATANDVDNGQTLTYSLLSAPPGASINATSGVFTWNPGSAGTFNFTVRVSDNGTPVLFDDEPITVTVNNAASSVIVAAAADAYTNNGTYATTNYGTATTLLIKTTPSAGVARATYLKFGLGTVSGTVTSAVLRVYGHSTEVGSVSATSTYSIANDAWTETGITWNTAPASATTPLNTINVTDLSKYYEFDVTSFVQTELTGDKTASFLIKNPTNLNRYFSFNSRENTKFPPQLVITTSAAAPTNQAPALDPIGNKTAIKSQALSFTATATDPDAGQTKTYSLIGAPAGAAINASTGVFTWTPTTTGSYNFTVRVTDDGSPVFYDEEQITVTVYANVTTLTFSNTQSAVIPNPGTATIPITVSGLPSVIDTLTYGLQSLRLNLTHPADAELTLQLQSPDGKLIYLFRKSPGININTTLDGVATQFIDNNEIATYTGSFSSTYRPRQELSLLNNGQNPNGTWNLIVKDDTSTSAAGNITSVSLTFGSAPAKPLLSSSTLPIVKIYTANGADIVDDPKVLGDIYIINNGAGAYNYANQTTYQYKGKIGIEIRGNSSSFLKTYPKKQYGFETRKADGITSNDVVLFGMPKQSDWILSSVMSDKSLLRNVLTYQIARQMGWWASRTQFCELMINDEYRGVFIFEEKIKKDANRVDIEKMATTDVTTPNVTGGYIFKLDDVDAGAVTWQTKFLPVFRRFQIVYPKPEDTQPAQKAYIQSYTDSFEAALHGPDFQDPAIGFRRFANDSSFIDFFLIAEMAKNVDTYHFSTYFSKKRGGKLLAMPVWDYDQAWRNDRYCNTQSPTGYDYIEVNNCGSRTIPWWWPRLMEDTKFKNDIVCRYNALRQTTLSLQNLYKIIDSSAGVLNAGGQQRNFVRWNVMNKYIKENITPYPVSYKAEIDSMKKWIADRVAWLDNDMGICINTVSKTARNTINLESDGATIGTVYPSPFNDHLYVALSLRKAQILAVKLVDMTGKLVYQKAISVQKGTQQIQLDFGGKQLAQGLYLLQVNGADFKTTKRVLKE